MRRTLHTCIFFHSIFICFCVNKFIFSATNIKVLASNNVYRVIEEKKEEKRRTKKNYCLCVKEREKVERKQKQTKKSNTQHNQCVRITALNCLVCRRENIHE